MDLALTELGSGSPLVVFVHGVLDRGRSFDRVGELLADECRMVWYDRRGYGESVDADASPVGVDGHVADLVGIIDGRRALLVGHSFGGVTVLGTALRVPELVEAVVLYETGLAWLPGWDDTFMQSVLWGEDPEGDGVRMMFRERFDEMPDDDRAARLLEARAFIAEERSIRTGEAPFDLAELGPPLVYGCSDSYPMTVVPDQLRKLVRRSEIVVVPGAGHNAHRSAPEAFADLVRRGIALRT
jgi:pimeloyl-ACP methyl ester carboxylesterase